MHVALDESQSAEKLLSKLKVGSALDPQKAAIIDSDESTVIMGVQVEESKIGAVIEKAKFYTSVCMGTTAILAVFAFLFLIPFVVEPAITTILADFSPHAVACVTTEHVYAEGLKNCSWASCREGCTSAALRCHQIKVNYTRLPYEEFMAKPLGSVPWDVTETKFFVNTEGCGYPPTVNCSIFAKKFAYENLGKVFPCYYSRTHPEIVVARYSWDENLRHLVLAIIVPIALFAATLGVLCYWYCPPINKTCGGSSRNLMDKYARKEDILAEDEFEEDEEEY